MSIPSTNRRRCYLLCTRECFKQRVTTRIGKLPAGNTKHKTKSKFRKDTGHCLFHTPRILVYTCFLNSLSENNPNLISYYEYYARRITPINLDNSYVTTNRQIKASQNQAKNQNRSPRRQSVVLLEWPVSRVDR